MRLKRTISKEAKAEQKVRELAKTNPKIAEMVKQMESAGSQDKFVKLTVNHLRKVYEKSGREGLQRLMSTNYVATDEEGNEFLNTIFRGVN